MKFKDAGRNNQLNLSHFGKQKKSYLKWDAICLQIARNSDHQEY